ncbi:uncharacterized protein BDV14DRAFT_199104 [Aspergillus stella-maris]|uniref:uncharacterized protein n=1 Tax=Aspergillus stella-maris TaxID=1810926 RepID=UPI003CCD98F8
MAGSNFKALLTPGKLQGTQSKRRDPNASRPVLEQSKESTNSKAPLKKPVIPPYTLAPTTNQTKIPVLADSASTGKAGQNSKIPKRPHEFAKSLEADEHPLLSSRRSPTTNSTVPVPHPVSQPTSIVPQTTNPCTENTPGHIEPSSEATDCSAHPVLTHQSSDGIRKSTGQPIRYEHGGLQGKVKGLSVMMEIFEAKMDTTMELLAEKTIRLEAYNREAERVLP